MTSETYFVFGVRDLHPWSSETVIDVAAVPQSIKESLEKPFTPCRDDSPHLQESVNGRPLRGKTHVRQVSPTSSSIYFHGSRCVQGTSSPRQTRLLGKLPLSPSLKASRVTWGRQPLPLVDPDGYWASISQTPRTEGSLLRPQKSSSGS